MVDAIIFSSMIVSILLYAAYNGQQNRYEYEEAKRKREERRRVELEKEFIKDYAIFFSEVHSNNCGQQEVGTHDTV